MTEQNEHFIIYGDPEETFINDGISTVYGDPEPNITDNARTKKYADKGGITRLWEKIKSYVTAHSGDENVQSDWNQSDTSADDYIKNKPTIQTYTAGTGIDITNGVISINLPSAEQEGF